MCIDILHSSRFDSIFFAFNRSFSILLKTIAKNVPKKQDQEGMLYDMQSVCFSDYNWPVDEINFNFFIIFSAITFIVYYIRLLI